MRPQGSPWGGLLLQATDCRPLICFLNIHRMFKMAKYATARKSPGRTAVAGNRLPPVDLLFDRSPDGRNDALRHRKSTPLRLQEAGVFYRNDKKRKVDDFPFLVVWVRRFELPASGRTSLRIRSGGRPLICFLNIHRMFKMAKYATANQPLLGFKRPEFPTKTK